MKARTLLLVAIAIGAVLFSRIAVAAPVEVTVDFSGAPSLSNDDKTAILMKMKDKYTGIDVNISTNAGGKVTVKFTDTEGDQEWGEANKKGKSAVVHVKRASKGAARQMAFDTDAKKRNLWGETGAHELGHLLCAVHNKDATVSLMTVGNKVDYAVRAADGRSFTADDKKNINMGIAMLNANKSWDLDAAYDNEDITMVPGSLINPETDLENDDHGVAFSTTISDPNFSIGFINDVNEYVHFLDPGSSLGAMEFGGGEYANFAISDGVNVYPFSFANGDTRTASGPLSPGLAYGSPPVGTYFSHVDLVFHNVGTSPHNVVLSLDTTGYGVNDGFAFAPLSVPEPTTWGLLAVACMVMGASRRRRA